MEEPLTPNINKTTAVRVSSETSQCSLQTNMMMLKYQQKHLSVPSTTTFCQGINGNISVSLHPDSYTSLSIIKNISVPLNPDHKHMWGQAKNLMQQSTRHRLQVRLSHTRTTCKRLKHKAKLNSSADEEQDEELSR